MKKGIIFFTLYGIILFIAFVNRDLIMEWLNQSDLSQLPLMFFLAVIFGVIPVVPFSIFAGLMGAKYGVWLGAAINWTGSVGAAAVFFVFARYLFVQQFQTYIQKYNGIKKFDSIISKNSFVAVLFSRMVPVVPPPVVNIYSGLSSMSFKVYILATAIGKVPGMIGYAYFGNHLFSSTSALILGLLLYILFLIVIILIYHLWFKRNSVSTQ